MHAKPQTVYQIVSGDTCDLPDVKAFIDTLNSLDTNSTADANSLFEANAELVITRAPGRLDVMGGIADYSGSLVLELPIAEATFVALQKDDEAKLRIVSLAADKTRDVSFEMQLSDLEQNGAPLEYSAAQRYFSAHSARHWAAYVAGVFLVLRRERNFQFDGGARLLISSGVPEGKGVSSSAALEVATMSAVAAAYSIDLEPRELALLCQQVENLVVGAPCGVMDQMTSACGEANQLLALLCQPAELLGTISLPNGLAVWGLDSEVRHSVSGADYGSVRVGAFMGYRIIADLAGLKAEKTNGSLRVEDPHWRGYLANLTPSEFEGRFAPHLPLKIEGAAFLERYCGTTDPVTRIDPERSYAVRIPAAHAVYENFRVRAFAELLRSASDGARQRRNELLGELMYQSHQSYSACGLGSSGTETIVSLVREVGAGRGLLGAKTTGGGSGGTVAVLGQQDADNAIIEVAQRYAEETGYSPYVFRGSSPGSAKFGYLRARRI
ncbi:MAG TPA: hypothetical protein VMM84_08075 [Pyrinomonadaceae bacterium]|nr:hypothetical protein [Pyrinomonadaceae bacterium]